MDTDRLETELRELVADRSRSRVFLIRLWKVEAAGGAEYRGSVRDVSSGAWRSFRDWSDVAAFMETQVDDASESV